MALDIGGSLTRKIGPLPAWAWLSGGGVVIYIYEKRKASSGTGTGSVAPAPATPQSPVVLTPGESVYDPNTGQLLGGGGGSDTGSGGSDGSGDPFVAGTGGDPGIGNTQPDPTDGGQTQPTGTTPARRVKAPKAPPKPGLTKPAATAQPATSGVAKRPIGTIITQGRGRNKKPVSIVGGGGFRFATAGNAPTKGRPRVKTTKPTAQRAAPKAKPTQVPRSVARPVATHKPKPPPRPRKPPPPPKPKPKPPAKKKK